MGGTTIRSALGAYALGLLLIALAAVACSDDSPADSSDVTDGGSDSGPDSGADPDIGDTGPPPGPWEDCPSSGDWVGEATWPFTVQITGDALYCGVGSERFLTGNTELTVDWAGQAAHRVQLWLPPGTYRLPGDDGTYTMRLPVCTLFGAADDSPRQAGDGTLEVTTFPSGDDDYRNYVLRQPLVSDDGTVWELEMRGGGPVPESAEDPLLVFDGSDFLPFAMAPGEMSLYVNLCSPDCTTATEFRQLDSCHFDAYPTRRHTVAFDGGQVELDLRYGGSLASTEPGQFVRTTGTLDGTAFEQTDYWDLVYTPGHHHFVRNFMVLFDPAIGDACALSAERLDEGLDPGAPDPTVTLFDCDFEPLEPRTVTGDTFELIPAAQ